MIPIILGAVLGAATGVLNFKILLHMTGRIAHMDQKKAGAYAIGGFFLRMLIYVGLVVVAAYVDQINVYAAGAGLLLSGILNLRDRNKIIEDVRKERTE